MASAEVSWPIASSARPYIGDESITRPPSFTNIDRTSSSCRQTSEVRSTSNALHVPSPITGSFSPEEGMVRVNIADDSAFACPRDASVGNIRPAVAVPIIFAASRRVTIPTVGRLIPLRQLAQCAGLSSISLSSHRLNSVKRQCIWHSCPTGAICLYGSPSFHKNIHCDCACVASNANVFICREDTNTDAHTHTRRHRIHWPVSGQICAESRTQSDHF